MTNPKQYLGRKAAKATLRHSVHGTVSKARREPPRSFTLVGVGVLVGIAVGLLVGRATAPSAGAAAAAEPVPAPEPVATA